MKLELGEYNIQLIPENDVERIYLRHFGFGAPGDSKPATAIAFIDAKTKIRCVEIKGS